MIRFLSRDSAIILIFGSVPDFLTKILPFFPIIKFAFLIAFLHLRLEIIFLFSTVTFTKICGNGLKMFKSSLALFFFLKKIKPLKRQEVRRQ